MIHLRGERTEVTGNCGNGEESTFGLRAAEPSSKIILHAPLTLASVSHGNTDDDYGGRGKIYQED